MFWCWTTIYNFCSAVPELVRFCREWPHIVAVQLSPPPPPPHPLDSTVTAFQVILLSQAIVDRDSQLSLLLENCSHFVIFPNCANRRMPNFLGNRTHPGHKNYISGALFECNGGAGGYEPIIVNLLPGHFDQELRVYAKIQNWCNTLRVVRHVLFRVSDASTLEVYLPVAAADENGSS